MSMCIVETYLMFGKGEPIGPYTFDRTEVRLDR